VTADLFRIGLQDHGAINKRPEKKIRENSYYKLQMLNERWE
jgi:hypothetical protein